MTLPNAALVSITEVLFSERYDILDGIAVASLGEVYSVFLAHKKPLEEIEVIECDPSSRTSVNLIQVLLAERGLRPKLKPLEGIPHHSDAVLLIGNAAIDFRRSSPSHQILDLGAAWYELTKLPFVYAVWAQHGPDPFSIIAPRPLPPPPPVTHLAAYTARRAELSTPRT